MTTNTLRRMPLKTPGYAIGIVIAAIILGIALSLVAFGSWGRERYWDNAFLVGINYFQTGNMSFMLLYSWRTLTWLRRYLFIGLVLVFSFLSVASFWLLWPQLPWGRAEAGRTAEDFMTALSVGDYSGAAALLSPVTQREISAEYLQGLDTQPVTWQFAPVPREGRLTGTAVFTDGVALPIEIGVTWLGNEWGVYQVTFGESHWTADGEHYDTLRMDFMACCDSSGPFEDALRQPMERLFAWLSGDR